MFTDACQALERELRADEGGQTILVTGDRGSGKTTVCETVIKRLNRHVVRWIPYGEFVVGKVSAASSNPATIVFVDDADVLVGLTKGSSVGLMDAIVGCRAQPHVRIVMTALDTKGRVWKSVASLADRVQTLKPSRPHRADSTSKRRAPRTRVGETDAWRALMRAADRAVVARTMINWSDERMAADEGRLDASPERGEEDPDQDHDQDTDGCIIRTIAKMQIAWVEDG